MFIGRRADGSIYGAWSVPQPDDADHPGQEEVADDLPELVAFQRAQTARLLGQSGVAALAARQRSAALEELDAAISALPAAQRAVFLQLRQLLKE